jgi:hypothetical protein
LDQAINDYILLPKRSLNELRDLSNKTQNPDTLKKIINHFHEVNVKLNKAMNDYD